MFLIWAKGINVSNVLKTLEGEKELRRWKDLSRDFAAENNQEGLEAKVKLILLSCLDYQESTLKMKSDNETEINGMEYKLKIFKF